jgi:hypothetical protein
MWQIGLSRRLTILAQAIATKAKVPLECDSSALRTAGGEADNRGVRNLFW